MIHKYSLNGYNIVLDTNSGAVHVMDEAPFAVLKFLRRWKGVLNGLFWRKPMRN